jgi:hypothetical protein
MVFAPTRANPLEAHEPAGALRRPERVARPPDGLARCLTWRAVVHIQDRETVQTTWHLAACDSPHEPAAHCPTGQRLPESVGDPDGHCLIDDNCARCQSAD